MVRPLRVFLSHTSDLASYPVPKSFVSAAMEAVNTAGDAISDMKYFAAREQHPPSYCHQKVAEADVYVAILGFRYGSLVKGQDSVLGTGEAHDQISYTELEFDLASERRIPRLVFILDEATPLPQSLAVDPTYGQRQVTFRRKVIDASGITVKKVSTVDQLERDVFHALVEVHQRFASGAQSQQPVEPVLPSRTSAAGSALPATKQARIRRLRQFAGAIRAQIEYLNKSQDWHDDQFEDLRALIRVEGNPSGARAVFGGSRNRPVSSLSHALLRTSASAVLLEGEPGSGKSVALRHLAHTMATSVEKRGKLTTPIPLYLTLKNFKPEGKPDSTQLRQFVKESLNASNDDAIERFLAEEFDNRLESGGWIFLFDSFDEIPAILSATDADEVVAEYANALHSFLNGLHGSRGIIATREYRGPRRIPWPRLRVLPLSDAQKRRLVRKMKLDRGEEAVFFSGLLTAQPSVVQIIDNPLSLSLVCTYIRTSHRFPDSAHQVYESYFGQRIKDSAWEIEEAFGLSAEHLRTSVDQIAFLMTDRRFLGLQPKHDELQQALAESQDSRVTDLPAVLEALERMRIGLSIRERGVSASFSFSHRRFQEYFATSYLKTHPKAVTPEELLTDGRWRESAVTIFQTQLIDVRRPILIQATRMMRDFASSFRKVDELIDQVKYREIRPFIGRTPYSMPFGWPEGCLHLMNLIQAGFAMEDPVVPDAFRADASIILKNALVYGERHEQRWALEVIGATTPTSALDVLEKAFRIGSPWLDEAAYSQLARLQKSVGNTRSYVRKQLTSYARSGLLRKNRASIRAEIEKFPRNAPERTLFKLLSWGPWADLAMCATFLCVYFYASVGASTAASVPFTLLGFLGLLAATLYPNPLFTSIPLVSRYLTTKSDDRTTISRLAVLSFIAIVSAQVPVNKYAQTAIAIVGAFLWVWMPAVLSLTSVKGDCSRLAYRLGSLSLLFFRIRALLGYTTPKPKMASALTVAATAATIAFPFLVVLVWPLVLYLFSLIQWDYWWVIGVAVIVFGSITFLIGMVTIVPVLARELRYRSQIVRDFQNEPVAAVVSKLAAMRSQAVQLSVLRRLRAAGYFNNEEAITALREAARTIGSEKVVDEIGRIVADYLKTPRTSA